MRSFGPSTRVLAAALLAVVVIGALAAVLSTAEGEPVSGSQAARAGEAALAEIGGGEVTELERSDDAGAAWEVEVSARGVEHDVVLDETFQVLASDSESANADESREGEGIEVSGPRGREPDRETGVELERAADSALDQVGGGEVVSVERSDDPGETYEVEIVRDGREIDVALDRELRPVRNRPFDD